MRAVIQRVTKCAVTVNGEVTGAIGPGILALVGVEVGDGENDAEYVAAKIADLRLFEPVDAGGPELSLVESGGAVLVVSQFTLLGDCRKGRRPSWTDAAAPEDARRWYDAVVERLRQRGLTAETGRFRAHMEVCLTNDGPVTVLLDSRKRF